MALLPGGKKWALGHTPEGDIIEKDPYLQPDCILEAIKEKRNTPADFDVLLTLSSTDPYPAVGTLVAVLALSYLALFKATSDVHHIDEAATLLKESISNCSHTDSNLPYLLDLHGYSFHLRFQQTGHHIYLDKADNVYRSALEIRHALEPQGTYPSIELAAVLCDRYKLSRHQKFLDDAIQSCRDSLALYSSRPRQRYGPAFILAEALMARYKVSGKPRDLEDVISLYQEALDLNPPPYFHRAVCLNSPSAPHSTTHPGPNLS